jgi:ComF family protein
MSVFVERVLEAVFPRFCVSCKAEGSLLCRVCDEGWNPERPKVLESKEDGVDGDVSKLWAALPYANPIARELITSWKYNYDTSAWAILRRRLAPQISHLMLTLAMYRVEAIVPLPLANQRRCERGFDQSVEIAKWLGVLTNLPVQNLLVRKHTVGHQADRRVGERLQAMVDSPFSLAKNLGKIEKSHNKRPDPSFQRVLLVDDVWTTGATMSAGARTLKNEGIEEVFGFVLARGK